MKIDYISRAVITAEHATKKQKQNLNQDERKLLLLCCEVFANPRKKIKQSAVQTLQIKALINKLQTAERPQPKQCCLAHIITSLFKNIFNILNLRVGIDRLERNIHQSFNKNFDKTPLSYAYREMFLQLKNCNLSSEKKEDVLQKLQSFYLLVLKRADFIHAPVLTKDLASLIKKQTGLVISQNLPKSLEDLKNAAAVLADQFEKVKRNPAEVKTFFEDAFDSKDVTFEKIFQRIANYSETVELPPSLKQPPVVKQPPLKQPPVKIEPKKVDNVNLVLGDQNKPKSKDETMYAFLEDFIEIQCQKYANDNPHYKRIPKWYQAKDDILKERNFNQEYANTENFENYLLNEKEILRFVCSDGAFSKENIAEFIEIYNIEMGVLGKKPKPFVFNLIPIAPRPMPVKIPDPVHLPQNHELTAKELINENRTNEFTEIYEEIINSVDTFKERFDQEAEAKKLKQNERRDYLIETLQAFYKVSLYRKEIWDYHQKYGANQSGFFIYQLIGLVIHTSYQDNNIKLLLDTCPEYLCEAYKKAKDKGRVYEFFMQAFEVGKICLENRYDKLSEDWVAKEAAREEWIINEAARKNLTTPNFVIDKNKNKIDNLYSTLKVFTDDQARKYAEDEKIVIDISWIEEDGPKKKIRESEKFFKNYLTKQAFEAALNKFGFIGKECKNKEIFTKADIDGFLDSLVDDETIS